MGMIVMTTIIPDIETYGLVSHCNAAMAPKANMTVSDRVKKYMADVDQSNLNAKHMSTEQACPMARKAMAEYSSGHDRGTRDAMARGILIPHSFAGIPQSGLSGSRHL
jgi:hypothetical protein